jgi:hypothetical protein
MGMRHRSGAGGRISGSPIRSVALEQVMCHLDFPELPRESCGIASDRSGKN